MDEFIKDVLAEEDLQTVVARYCTEDFEHSGARGGNSLITGVAAALAMGNGGEIISTEEAIRAHNQDHPDYIIPLNRVTRRIPSGLINTIAQTMVERHWQFNRFMGEFARYVLLYSSILSVAGLITGAVAISMMAAFLAGLVLTQGMSRVQVRLDNGNRLVAHSMDAGWAQPIEPPQVEAEIPYYTRIHENRNETREEFIMRAGYVSQVNEKVAGLPVKKAVYNEDMQLLGYDDEGTVRQDTPNTVGWDSNSGNLLSRMALVPKMRSAIMPVDGQRTDYAFMGNIIADDNGKPKEKEESKFRCIRCMAKKRDGGRCNNIISYDDAMGNPGIFCGIHNKNPNQARVTDKWAVDDGCDMMGGRTTGPASRKELASDENKLRF